MLYLIIPWQKLKFHLVLSILWESQHDSEYSKKKKFREQKAQINKLINNKNAKNVFVDWLKIAANKF